MVIKFVSVLLVGVPYTNLSSLEFGISHTHTPTTGQDVPHSSSSFLVIVVVVTALVVLEFRISAKIKSRKLNFHLLF